MGAKPTIKVTELESFEPDRVDGVGKGANGFPILLMKGLSDEVEKAKCKTCDGTGKIMEGHRKCPDCNGDGKAPEDDAEKATLSAKDRDALDEDEFAYVDSKGEKHLPVNDEGHVKAALGRFGQTQFDSDAAKKATAKKILAAAKKFDIDVSNDTDVAEAAKSVLKAASDEDETPGSPGWEQADAQTMADAAEMLLQVADKIKVFIGRENEEYNAGEAGELCDIFDGQDALALVTHALGLVARLSMQEAHSGASADEAAKAGKVLSAKSKSAIHDAIAALNDLLASAGETDNSGDAAKAGEDILTMTKEELFAALDERDALKAAAAEEAAAKAATETADGETTPAAEDETTKSAVTLTVEQLEEVVAKGVAKAQAPLQERLETVEKMAAPGGPVKTRTPDDLAKSSSRETLIAQAEELERRSRALASDPELRKAYQERAEQVRAQAAAIA